jgi:hypothetical protein
MKSIENHLIWSSHEQVAVIRFVLHHLLRQREHSFSVLGASSKCCACNSRTECANNACNSDTKRGSK